MNTKTGVSCCDHCLCSFWLFKVNFLTFSVSDGGQNTQSLFCTNKYISHFMTWTSHISYSDIFIRIRFIGHVCAYAYKQSL